MSINDFDCSMLCHSGPVILVFVIMCISDVMVFYCYIQFILANRNKIWLQINFVQLDIQHWICFVWSIFLNWNKWPFKWFSFSEFFLSFSVFDTLYYSIQPETFIHHKTVLMNILNITSVSWGDSGFGMMCLFANLHVIGCWLSSVFVWMLRRCRFFYIFNIQWPMSHCMKIAYKLKIDFSNIRS